MYHQPEITEINLFKCPLEEGDENQILFNHVDEQNAYFNALPRFDLENATYQRKEQIIRWPGNADLIRNYNYVRWNNYRDNEGVGKWYFAFITNIEYASENMSFIHVKLDTFQTWQFELKYKACFVEREHVNNDSRGLHTVPENVELGEMVVNQTGAELNITNMYIVFQVSEVIDQLGAQDSYKHGGLYNNIFSGLSYFYVKDIASARWVISQYQQGKESAIVSIFYAPSAVLPSQTTSRPSTGITIYWITELTSATNFDNLSVPMPTNLGFVNGEIHHPRNNKLLTYPYSYLRLSNNVGNDAIFKYEDFGGNSADFVVQGSLGQGCSIFAHPAVMFKGALSQRATFDYGIPMQKLPILGWATDYYTNWQTQNAVNFPMQGISGAVQAVGSFMGGNIVGGVSSVVNTIGNMVSQQYEAKLAPDQARGNANSSDITFSSGYYKITAVGFSIRPEYARIIDDYFDMFGYKVNRLKVPNVRGRANWNYVKTVDCYIEANIPQADLNEIKGFFDRGIRLWHNPANFMNYSVNNGII